MQRNSKGQTAVYNLLSLYIISFSTDFCLLPPDVGQGTSFTLAVHYDVNKDQCTPFLYNGEGGNANRFENESECITQCREYLPY
uniref:BPTI/Kunitz inhibitor domain-containing protein n=1 Tax=Astatotilapia calliptera TaxID=8154 RepID=A0A3P8Q9T1_ASTCA